MHCIIPNPVREVLRFGLKRCVGGKPRPLELLVAFERLYEKWKIHAESEGLSKLEIFEVHTDLATCFNQLKRVHSNDRSFKVIQDFLLENPDVIITKADKEKSVIIWDKETYNRKLRAELPAGKFEKLLVNPLEKDIDAYGKIIKEMKPYLSKSTINTLRPRHSLKRCYSIIKSHKFGMPSRLIIGTCGSIAEGAEFFLQPILKKLRESTKYRIKNTQELKNNFCRFKSKIDLKTHAIISLDVKSMFPALPVKEISHIIAKKVFENPTFYFDAEELEGGHVSEFPDREAFKTLLDNVLFKLTSFSTTTGYYRQRDGSSMGSKLSPLLADIFMHEIECPFFNKLRCDGKVMYYGRFVDDSLIICLKEEIDNIFSLANKLHKNIEFTMEQMVDGKISYLDTEFRAIGDKVEMFHYEKPSTTDLLPNFLTNVSPKSQKISLLVGHLHRIQNASSCEEAIEEGFQKIKKRYLLNQYPLSLINEKIKLVRSPREKITNDEEVVHNFKACFTGLRCDSIGRKMRAILKAATPKFFLRLCWKTIRIEQCLHPTWKRQIPIEQKSGVVYMFSCPCGKTKYQGETKRQVSTRIKEHFEAKSRSPMFFHSLNCEKFRNELQTYLSEPDTPKYKPRTSRGRIRADFCFKRNYISILSNQPYNRERKLYEAFSIKLTDPCLNKQVKFEETLFL